MMARKVEYYCDECKESFGDRTHINVKNGDVRISYKNPIGSWSQKKINVPCNEYHFCNGTCLCTWLTKHIEAVPTTPTRHEVNL